MDAAKNRITRILILIFLLEFLTSPNFCQLCPAGNELYKCQTEKPLK